MSSSNFDTRTRILEATRQLLERAGGREVRMQDIAAAAGISRQALYLHFATRTELLVATTHYLDQQLGLEQRLQASRSAKSGEQRLHAYIEFWGSYIPEIYGVGRALMVAQETDEAAAAAWGERMGALRDGCRAAIEALHADGRLAREWTVEQATDLLWSLLSVRNWEQLTRECTWSNRQYIQSLQQLVKRTFVCDT